MIGQTDCWRPLAVWQAFRGWLVRSCNSVADGGTWLQHCNLSRGARSAGSCRWWGWQQPCMDLALVWTHSTRGAARGRHRAVLWGQKMDCSLAALVEISVPCCYVPGCSHGTGSMFAGSVKAVVASGLLWFQTKEVLAPVGITPVQRTAGALVRAGLGVAKPSWVCGSWLRTGVRTCASEACSVGTWGDWALAAAARPLHFKHAYWCHS
jgi:hypothetical protein